MKLKDTPGYKRMRGEHGEEIGVLGVDCGSHCGVITVGNAKQHVAHCACKDCHG